MALDLGKILERYDIPVNYYTVEPRTWNVNWQGLMFHHTVSNPPRNLPSLPVVQKGRPDVPGPLANFMTPRDGAFAAHITNGGANHPGAGDLTVLTRLQSGAPPTGRPGSDVRGASYRARAALIGFECENNGTGEPWGGPHLDLIAHCFAAFCMHFGWNPLVVIIGHKEWTRRKIDPFPIDMAAFRYRVQGLTRTPPTITPPKPTEEQEIMAVKDEIIEALTAVIDQKIEEAFQQEEARDAAWEWDTRKLTVPRAARIDGENAQFYVAGTEAGPRRFWIKNLAELSLLRTMNVVSHMEEYVVTDHAEQVAFRSIPIAGDAPDAG